MSKPTVLLSYSVRSTFVTKDINILSEQFNVLEFNFYSEKKWQTPFKLIQQKLFLLRHIFSTDILICQFGSYHSYLPALYGRLFGKPCVIIAGGTEAHFFPGIGYGNWQKGLLKLFTQMSFRLCSHIAPKHKSLMFCEYTYDSSEPNPQGIYARMPGLKVPYTEITNGYDEVTWQKVKDKKQRTFITVANGWEFPFQQQLKGVDLILEAATAFPDCEFIILGVADPSIIATKSTNVKLLPPVKNSDLISIFSECTFYMQLSIAEGFPNSLCEAMLCECVPIGSNVFSIPEIIGDSGFVLKHRNADELKALIAEALKSDTQTLGKKARNQIVANYTLEVRKNKLLQLCKSLISK